ncbi:uncharacterized protein LOC115301469 [Suricata suricatta]|uniref:uncharacterized protein LOC115301469 n=1 Tax=Suricata suricatta TaxID=37032 RepID=UPI001155A597|nr:uncharacterized protein LOC115301469 [Suricata suricatta]
MWSRPHLFSQPILNPPRRWRAGTKTESRWRKEDQHGAPDHRAKLSQAQLARAQNQPQCLPAEPQEQQHSQASGHRLPGPRILPGRARVSDLEPQQGRRVHQELPFSKVCFWEPVHHEQPADPASQAVPRWRVPGMPCGALIHRQPARDRALQRERLPGATSLAGAGPAAGEPGGRCPGSQSVAHHGHPAHPLPTESLLQYSADGDKCAGPNRQQRGPPVLSRSCQAHGSGEESGGASGKPSWMSELSQAQKLPAHPYTQALLVQ